MTFRSSYRRASLVMTLTGILMTSAGCFDDPTEVGEGGKLAPALNTKHDSSWMPSGLADLGKLVGPWDSPGSTLASTTMDYVWDGFDLETAVIHEAPPGDQFASQVDFHLAYNADTSVHVRLFQEYPAWVAFLDATPLGKVTPAQLRKATFTQDVIDRPLDPDDTVVVVTADGNCFKIGNAAENDNESVTIDFEQVQCPE